MKTSKIFIECLIILKIFYKIKNKKNKKRKL